MAQEKKEERALLELIQANPKQKIIFDNPYLLDLLSLLAKKPLPLEEIRFSFSKKSLSEVIASVEKLEVVGLLAKITIKEKTMYYANSNAKSLLEKIKTLKTKLNI